MNLIKRIVRVVGSLYFERPAEKLTLSEHAANLKRDGQKIEEKIRAVRGSDANRHKMRHIIGIEAWGQRRLKVALGEPFVLDEYDGYQPPATLSWDSLLEIFQQTRQTTIELAYAIDKQRAGAAKVTHNDFGDFSIKGWLRYLNSHATIESKRLK